MDASSLSSSRALGASTVSTEDIKTLIAQKERELHDINEFRQQSIESLLAAAEKENGDLRAKITKIKDDFQFNLKLFEERDVELDRLETENAELRNSNNNKNAEIASLKAQLGDARARNEAERSRVTDLENFYSEQLKTLRDSIESARRARDEESKKWRLEYEAARESYEARLSARENEYDAHKREISEAADAAITAIQRDSKRREEECNAAVREATDKLIQAQRAADESRAQMSSVSAALDATRHALRAAEADAAEARANAEATRAEYDTAIASLAAEKDAANSSKQALLEQYEGRMNDLLNSLRQVQHAFQAEKEEYEARLAAVQNESAASTREYAALMEARLQALVVRLSEAESAAHHNEEAAHIAQQAAAEATQRAVAAEQQLADVKREYDRVKDDGKTAESLTSAQIESLNTRLRVLQSDAESATSTIARLKAELAAAERKTADQEVALQSINSTWEQAAAQREVAAVRALEEQLVTVIAQRDILAQQLRTALIAAGNTAAAAALMNAVALGTGSDLHSAAARAGLSSAGLLVPSGGPKQNSVAESTDVRASGELLATTIQAKEEKYTSLLSSVQSLETELGEAKAECVRLREALAQSRGQLAGLQARVQGPHHSMEFQAYGAPGASIASQFTGDMGPASPPQPFAVGYTSHSQLREVEALRARCAELESQTGAFKAVISDMRGHMELLQQQLDLAHNGSVVEGDKSLSQRLEIAEREREETAQELAQAQDYIKLLQQRAEANYNSSAATAFADNDDHTELIMLRGHLRTLSESTAALRSRLRQVQLELASRSQESGAGSAPHRAASSLEAVQVDDGDAALQDQLRSAHADVQRLLDEREKLLELSNQLRADLNRTVAKAGIGRSGSQADKKVADKAAVEPPKVPSKPIKDALSLDAHTASRMAYLESALVSLAEQNAQLQQEVRRMADTGRRIPAGEGRRATNDDPDLRVQSAPAAPPQPPARSQSASREIVDSLAGHHAYGRDTESVRPTVAEARSPSRSRLDAAKRRLDASNPWATSSIAPVEDVSPNMEVGTKGDIPGGHSRLIAPSAVLRVSQARINPKYTQAALAARSGSEDVSRGSRHVSARSPTPVRSTSRPRSPAEDGALAGRASANVGATAAALAREKARQAAVVTAKLRNYNDKPQ